MHPVGHGQHLRVELFSLSQRGRLQCLAEGAQLCDVRAVVDKVQEHLVLAVVVFQQQAGFGVVEAAHALYGVC